MSDAIKKYNAFKKGFFFGFDEFVKRNVPKDIKRFISVQVEPNKDGKLHACEIFRIDTKKFASLVLNYEEYYEEIKNSCQKNLQIFSNIVPTKIILDGDAEDKIKFASEFSK